MSSEYEQNTDVKNKQDDLKEAESIEFLSLYNLLKSLSLRINSIEDKLSNRIELNQSQNSQVLEYLKIFLGGWPAFGLIFLVLFYFPLKDVFKSIPEKVRSANEIQVGSLSLKSTIQEVANFKGLINLGEVIPTLSNSAIELMLKAPSYGESLISFTNSIDNNSHTVFNMPSDEAIIAFNELESKGLIELRGGLDTEEKINGVELENLCAEIQKEFPGIKKDSYNNNLEMSWELDNAIPRDSKLPMIMWQLTERGQKAVGIILEAVTKELSKDNND